MNTWKIVLTGAATALLAGHAVAQSAPEEGRRNQAREVGVQLIEEREAEVERRMYEAEQRMAEAARQIAELAAERLPNVERFQRHIEIFGGDKPRLGVTIGGEGDGPVEGVPILAVTPGSAAAEAGLRAGDVITAINDESLSAASPDEASDRLLDFMRGVVLGDTLEVEYLRDDKVGKVEVEPKPVSGHALSFSGNGGNFSIPAVPNVQVRPPLSHGPSGFFLQWHNDGWGDLELVELNAGLGKYFGTDEGLLVVNAPDATSLQLEDGDVIQKIDGRQPTSVRHALRILGSYQAGEKLKLEIMRDKKRRTLDVEIPDDRSGFVVPDGTPMVRPAGIPRAPRPSTPAEKT